MWTDAPYLTGKDYTDLTPAMVKEKWDAMPSGRRFILFAPKGNYSYYNGGKWENISSWKNLVHLTDLYSGLGDMEYILENIIGELTGRSVSRSTTPSNYVEIIPSENY